MRGGKIDILQILIHVSRERKKKSFERCELTLDLCRYFFNNHILANISSRERFDGGTKAIESFSI